MSTYNIDKAHSEMLLTVRHLVTKVRGHFTDFSGTLQFDPAQPERASISIKIDAASVDTGTGDRDTHLKSDDFFGVATFPHITFVSSKVAKKGDEQFIVTGTLTIRGVAKEINVPVSYLGLAKDPWGNSRAGFEGEITINRKDFGLMWNAALETGGFLVGDDVKISVSIQAVAQ